MKEEDGKKMEPYEEAVVEVGEEYNGSVVELLANRKGEMLDLITNDKGMTTIKYKVPTRGLLGVRNAILTATRGTAVLNTIFDGYYPYAGEIAMRENGSLIAFETGQVTSYACFSAQDRGVLFVKPGTDVYEGQVVGIHQRTGDLKVNVASVRRRPTCDRTRTRPWCSTSPRACPWTTAWSTSGRTSSSR